MGQCPASLWRLGEQRSHAGLPEAGDTILGFDLAHGGHDPRVACEFSGKLYRPTFYGVEKETGTIDMDKVAETARTEKPR